MVGADSEIVDELRAGRADDGENRHGLRVVLGGDLVADMQRMDLRPAAAFDEDAMVGRDAGCLLRSVRRLQSHAVDERNRVAEEIRHRPVDVFAAERIFRQNAVADLDRLDRPQSRRRLNQSAGGEGIMLQRAECRLRRAGRKRRRLGYRLVSDVDAAFSEIGRHAGGARTFVSSYAYV